MPKGSEERINSRKEEIIDACASLYETMGFRDITIRDIGRKTSFTRTSIYNYFQTKEEIFLALLQREYEAWTADLEAVCLENEALSVEGFADALARSLERRGCMLKLLCMNLYDMEGSSRLENLVEFKRVYARARESIARCLSRFFPAMAQEEIEGFLYAFFPFLFGVYPYTSMTEKQKEAMDLAGVGYPRYSVYEIVKDFAVKLLGNQGGGKEEQESEEKGKEERASEEKERE